MGRNLLPLQRLADVNARGVDASKTLNLEGVTSGEGKSYPGWNF